MHGVSSRCLTSYYNYSPSLHCTRLICINPHSLQPATNQLFLIIPFIFSLIYNLILPLTPHLLYDNLNTPSVRSNRSSTQLILQFPENNHNLEYSAVYRYSINQKSEIPEGSLKLAAHSGVRPATTVEYLQLFRRALASVLSLSTEPHSPVIIHMSINERDGVRRGSRALSPTGGVGSNSAHIGGPPIGSGGGSVSVGGGHSPMARDGRLGSATSGNAVGAAHTRLAGGAGGHGGGGGLAMHGAQGDAIDGPGAHTSRKSSTASQPVHPFGLPPAAGDYTSRVALFWFIVRVSHSRTLSLV